MKIIRNVKLIVLEEYTYNIAVLIVVPEGCSPYHFGLRTMSKIKFESVSEIIEKGVIKNINDDSIASDDFKIDDAVTPTVVSQTRSFLRTSRVSPL